LFIITILYSKSKSKDSKIDTILKKTNVEYKYKHYEDPEENEEWEALHFSKNFEHKKLFIRRSASFYIPEKRLIRTLSIGEALINYPIEFLLLFENGAQSKNKELTLPSSSMSSMSLTTYQIYGTHTIDCYLPQNMFFDYKSVTLYLNAKSMGKIYFTKRPMNVQITKSNDLANTGQPSGSIMLCSKQYNFTVSEYPSFKIWIELNKNLGYEKLVIYNNSIPDEKFTQLFQQYDNFIESREYKYYPHLYLDSSASRLAPGGYQYHLQNLSLELRRVHERLAINECYLSHRGYYDKIAILDYDEIIIPRMLTNISINNYDNF
jgi:hypothetical protein